MKKVLLTLLVVTFAVLFFAACDEENTTAEGAVAFNALRDLDILGEIQFSNSPYNEYAYSKSPYNGVKTKEVKTTAKTSDGTKYYKSTTTYNSNGVTKSYERSESSDDSNYTQIEKQSYTISGSSYTIDDGSFYKTGSTEYTVSGSGSLNSNNLVTQSIYKETYSYGGANETTTSQTDFEYDGYNQTKYSSTYTDATNNVFTYSVTYAFDSGLPDQKTESDGEIMFYFESGGEIETVKKVDSSNSEIYSATLSYNDDTGDLKSVEINFSQSDYFFDDVVSGDKILIEITSSNTLPSEISIKKNGSQLRKYDYDYSEGRVVYKKLTYPSGTEYTYEYVYTD
jgi:hypothetical protein